MNQPSFGKIPPDLVESIAQGSCVLFLGADALYDTPEWSGPPSRDQLAAALAAKYDWVAPGQELRFAAEEFLGREPENLHGLISLVREQVAACTRPGPVHQLVVDLGFDAVVTNGYDTLLETAMQAAGRRMLQVVGDAEIAYAGGKEEVIIIHLAGAVDRPESLVLTDADQIKVENHLSEKLQAVRGWCTLRPLLFVGWDPEDDAFRRLYIAATEKLGRHKRRNYLVWPAPSPRASAFCKSYNVEIIPAQPLPFLRALAGLAQQKRALRPGYRPGEVVGKLPYKFLDYFDPGDRDIFCGREVEAPLVYRMALSYPLLTLFGQSGVGKTSLLRAGVVPLLVEEGYHYAYIRALGDPLRAIRQGVCGALSLPPTAESAGEGEALLDFFRRALGDGGRLMVILDQFEELFIRSGKSTRKQFWRELGACLGLTNPEVRFILSLREDYLAELDEARRPLEEGAPPPVPDILRNRYRLTSLEADTAYLAIVEPARRACCRVEPGLADLLLGRAEMPVGADRAPAHWSLAEADGGVPPPSLQIVMDRLYRQALADAGGAPPAAGAAGQGWLPPPLALTLDLYRAMGGVRTILAGYVADALGQVPEQGGDRALAETLLKVMVTSQATKAALDDAELLAGVAEADSDFDPDDPRAAACLRATLAALVNLRLVRGFKVGEGALYELAHDHMAAEIATWIGEEEMQAKLARELLRREMESYRALGKLIEPEALKLIHERYEDLKRLQPDELELLLVSTLVRGYPVSVWMSSVRLLDKESLSRVLERVAEVATGKHPDAIRKSAILFLGAVGVEESIPYVVESLLDKSPAIREVARESLRSFSSEKVIQQLAKGCLDIDSKRRLLAALSLRHFSNLQDVKITSQIYAGIAPEQTRRAEQALQIVQSPKDQVPFQTPNLVCLSITDDSDFAASIEGELYAAGHLVDTSSDYGFHPESFRIPIETLLNYQVVLLFRGVTYSRGSMLEIKERLVGFVRAGGTLVATPFVAWEDSASLRHILPVLIKEDPLGYHGNVPITWKTISEHPLCQSLSPTISFQGSYESLVNVPDAEVLIVDDKENPALALKTFGLGRVIYLNVCSYFCHHNLLDKSNELRNVFTNVFEWLARQYCCDLSERANAAPGASGFDVI